MVKIKNRMDWSQYAGKTYFEDFDVVCIGSPIIAGSPTSAMIKLFSLGGGSDLEKDASCQRRSRRRALMQAAQASPRVWIRTREKAA